MITGLGSLYAQYPVLKKIGKDSVILISVKQGQEINKQFDKSKAEISALKDSLAKTKLREEFYRELYTRHQYNVDSLRTAADTNAVKYRVATSIYTDHERQYSKYLRNTSIFATIVTFFIMILSSQK